MRVHATASFFLTLAALGAAFAPSTLRVPHVPRALAPHRIGESSSAVSLWTAELLAPPSFRAASFVVAAKDGDGDGESDGDGDKSLGSKMFDAYTKSANAATTLFPIWTVLCSGIALRNPSAFAWFTTEYFTAGLAALMLSMGITLKPSDFTKVLSRPNAVLMQFSLCYLMMPLLALALGKAFALDPALLAGMVLVGSINGGQASNLCTYIARGNVALSVIMTTATTLGAIFMTPVLCKALLGTVVPVDARGIAISTIQVVLAPIAIGMLTNNYFPSFVKAILPFAPVVGVVSTCLLVASAVAQVAEPIMAAGLGLQIPVLLLHLLGGLIGYLLPRNTGFGETASRTMAIETSMKSSAFGFLLAKLHFGEYAARVPSAVSVVWMALTGSTLAVIWRYIPVVASGTFDRTIVERYPPFDMKKFFKKKSPQKVE